MEGGGEADVAAAVVAVVAAVVAVAVAAAVAAAVAVVAVVAVAWQARAANLLQPSTIVTSSLNCRIMKSGSHSVPPDVVISGGLGGVSLGQEAHPATISRPVHVIEVPGARAR